MKLRPVPKVLPHVALGSRAHLRRVCEFYAHALREIEESTRPGEGAWELSRRALTASVAEVIKATQADEAKKDA